MSVIIPSGNLNSDENNVIQGDTDVREGDTDVRGGDTDVVGDDVDSTPFNKEKKVDKKIKDINNHKNNSACGADSECNVHRLFTGMERNIASFKLTDTCKDNPESSETVIKIINDYISKPYPLNIDQVTVNIDDVVRELNKLNANHLAVVVECLNKIIKSNSSSKITNMKNYILAVIFKTIQNNPTELRINNYRSSKVKNNSIHYQAERVYDYDQLENELFAN